MAIRDVEFYGKRSIPDARQMLTVDTKAAKDAIAGIGPSGPYGANPVQNLSKIGQALLGYRVAGLSREKEDAALASLDARETNRKNAMAAAIQASAKPPIAAVPGQAATVEQPGYEAQLAVPPQPGRLGGNDAMIASLLGNDPLTQRDTSDFTQEAILRRNAQRQAAAALKEQRAHDDQIATREHTRAMQVAGVKEKGTTTEQEYDRAVLSGYVGPFWKYQQDTALANQGLLPKRQGNGTPESGEGEGGYNVVPGSRADIQAKQVAARERSNKLAAARLALQEEQASPDYILEKKRLESTATMQIGNERAMPGRRASIMTKIEREPIMRKTVEDIKELTKSWATGGTLGQMLANRPEADQYLLNKKLEVIKASVGLQELIDIKAAGGTFGALSDTEMTLLISAVGALDPFLPEEELAGVLDDVMRLYSRGLDRRKSDFKDMYPDVKRPWDEQVGDPGEGEVLEYDALGNLI
tara:strand:+ start:3140 stop:4552 length:1413 start_codon:yes stop_codon:yes gene_type:complete